MILIAEMQNGGVFEAPNKKKLTAKMVKYYAENDCQPEQIKGIFYVLNNGKTDEVCQKVVDKIQDIIDEGVAEWRQTVNDNCQNQQEIESEVRRTIYG